MSWCPAPAGRPAGRCGPAVAAPRPHPTCRSRPPRAATLVCRYAVCRYAVCRYAPIEATTPTCRPQCPRPDDTVCGHANGAQGVTWVQALVLGLVQGLTEFLPISSSGHLRIVSEAFFGDDAGASFTAVTQLGTEAAVLIYFARDIGRLAAT